MHFYKHYIRINSNSFILDSFSDAFQQPIEGDICVNEYGGRHFSLKLKDSEDNYLLIWDGESIIEASVLQKMDYYRNIEVKREKLRGLCISLLSDTDSTQLSDSPLNEEAKALWSTWRTDIRTLKDTQQNPFDVTIPPPPSNWNGVEEKISNY